MTALAFPYTNRKWLDTLPKIQAEIDRLGSTGGLVEVAPTTIEASVALQLASNIHLRGAPGFQSIIQAQAGGDFSMVAPATRTAIVGGTNVDNVVVEGLQVDANGESGVSGIAIFGGNRPRLIRNYVHSHGGAPGSGVHLYGAQQVGVNPVYGGLIAGNHVENYAYNLVFDGNVEGSAIIGNTSRNTTAGGAVPITHIALDGNEGIPSSGVVGAAVSGNVCLGRRAGVSLHKAKAVLTGNNFADLNLSSCFGFRVFHADADVVVSGNWFGRNLTDGVVGDAFLLSGGRAIVTGNHFRRFARGIVVTAAGTYHVHSNFFHDITGAALDVGDFASSLVQTNNYEDANLIS